MKPRLAEDRCGCRWQSWGILSQEVPRLLLGRAYDRDLRTVLSFWALAGTRQLTFRRVVQRGFGNFYETWNSAPYLSHVIKISLVVPAASIHGSSTEPICRRRIRQIRRSGDGSLREGWHPSQDLLSAPLQNMEPFILSNTVPTSLMKLDLLYTAGAGQVKVTKHCRWTF